MNVRRWIPEEVDLTNPMRSSDILEYGKAQRSREGRDNLDFSEENIIGELVLVIKK